jgi:pilus assembly protein Flp/PilA
MQNQFFARLIRFAKQDDGPTAVEYAILMSLIVVVCVGAVKGLASQTAATFDRSAIAIDEAMNQ